MRTYPSSPRLLVVWLALLVLAGLHMPAAAQGSPLDDGNRALTNGDYDTAVTAFTNAANDPAVKCPAVYGLGQTYLRMKQYDNTDATFTRYLTECENSFRGLVMRGEARQELGRAADALADYQQAIALKPGVLDSYLYERMASLDPDQSAYYLRLAAESPRQPEGAFALREKLAQVYLLVGNSGGALAQYTEILSEIDSYLATLGAVPGAEFDKNGSLRARIEEQAAEIEIDTDQLDAGYARLQRVIATYWQTPSALPALVTLVSAAQPVDLLTRMRINVLNENYFPVVDVLTDYLSNADTAASAPAELYLLLGKAQRGQGDLAGALNTFAKLRQQFPDDPIASEAAYEQGQTYAQGGDSTQAAATYNQLVTLYPQAPQAADALLRAAQAEADPTRELALYDQLAQQYPTSDAAKRGLFAIGMQLRSQDPARAADYLAKAGTAEAQVWRGKLLQQQGDTAGAQAAWQQAQALEPGTFFALRGCELLNGRETFRDTTTVEIPAPDPANDKATAAQWVSQVFGVPGISADLSPELAANPILERGVELWAVGMSEEARQELDALHKLNRVNPAALLQLAFYYRDIPINRSSVFAATRLIFASNQPLFTIPPALLRLAYPVYYSDLITQYSNENALDPLLVAALTLQESSYDATNISIANARGLMQLVPTTAQDVANQLAWPNYTVDDLNRPIVNIAFGAHYLSAMKAFQDGSAVGALLSYNAGPGAAQGWLNEAGGDVDVLYQVIDFAETKTYLDVIYVNHFIYQYLYSAGMPTCGFELPAPVQPTPAATTGA